MMRGFATVRRRLSYLRRYRPAVPERPLTLYLHDDPIRRDTLYGMVAVTGVMI